MNSVDEINALIQKYSPLIELKAKQQEHVPLLAYVYDTAINYIKENYSGLTKDWKAWTVFVVGERVMSGQIAEVPDIKKTIDDFIGYWKLNYQPYLDDLALYSSEFDRDAGFVKSFL
ncbi:MAG: hypothetical protein WC333_01890 [Dehalococcoidia bacterium]